jgi:prolyl-tRNA synthetase
MRVSRLYAPTLRETPADAEIVSQQLMLRAGMIRRVAPGVYNYLPLAWRVLKKISQIVREEMDAKGGQELMMPIAQPAELWRETGRWDVYGEEMFRLKDRHGRDFCLGPTHEEMITTLVRQDVRSYRQLPILLYQIQDKFRDEIRPRFGLMRGREFIMKDLYSFDRDDEGLNRSYWDMHDAYSRSFARCGLTFRAVEADSGAIGGSGSHEFMVMANSGEAEICFCSACEYAANTERAEMHAIPGRMEPMKELEIVNTPNCKTMEEVAKFLGFTPEHAIKALAFYSDKGPVLALVRGDHGVNEIKLKNTLDCLFLTMADQAVINDLMGSSAGYIGPIGISKETIVVADHTVMNMCNTECGANKQDHHYINVNPGRDFKPTMVADIRLIEKGDPCPRCGASVEIARGIEVGHIFKLQTKYSEKLNAVFVDENGEEKPMIMGCYGIGIGRTMAAAIEQNHDKDGIIWPVSIAPFQVIIVPVSIADEAQRTVAEKLYKELNAVGIECILDDREERAGVKFKDADLIGYPLRITIGPKALQDNKVECRIRKTGEVQLVLVEQCLETVKNLLAL